MTPERLMAEARTNRTLFLTLCRDYLAARAVLGTHLGYPTSDTTTTRAAEQAAATAPTTNLRNASASVAAWLRGLADEVERGEL